MEVQAQHPVWKLWLNPILRRYCRSRLRLRAVLVVLLIDLLIAGFIVGMTATIGSRDGVDLADVAGFSFIVLLFYQGFILFIMGAAVVSGGIVAERDEGVIDYQRLAPMTPLAKTLGYLFGLPMREYVMFLGTLPFALWLIYAGKIAFHVWAPLYVVMLSSAVLYHLTGLVTGTVVRNRRVAFLFSTGCVFTLYTVLPFAKKYGLTVLVFFDYLTMGPVYRESLPGMLPNEVGAVVEMARLFSPEVKFFNLGFSEIVFTLFTQVGLMLTLIIMLCRKWRSDENHLLGKTWAAGLFVWIQFLLLGNALPLIETGKLFPSYALTSMLHMGSWTANEEEIVGLVGLYGFVTLVLMVLLTSVITPTIDRQKKAWRYAHKHGEKGSPLISDPATSWFYVVAMAVVGGLSWFFFSRAFFETKWFTGGLGLHVAIYFILVLLAAGLIFQTLLEGRGKKMAILCAIGVGVVPIMGGAVLTPIVGMFSSMVFAISPLSMPVYGATVLLPTDVLTPDIEGLVSFAFHLWLLVGLGVAVFFSFRLRRHHRRLAQWAETTAEKAADSSPPQESPPAEANAPQ